MLKNHELLEQLQNSESAAKQQKDDLDKSQVLLTEQTEKNTEHEKQLKEMESTKAALE